MTTYQELDWKTLAFLKDHLYRRLAAPLNQTINHIERANVIADAGLSLQSLTSSQYQLEGLMNLINAWSTLITYKNSGVISDTLMKDFTPDKLPAWIKETLEQHLALRIDFKVPILIHLETFLEALLLLYEVGAKVGSVAVLQLIDAPMNRPGVYLRLVFTAKDENIPFLNLSDVASSLENERDPYTELMVLRDLLALNNAALTLQNNKKTGQQALAAYFQPHGKYAESHPQERHEAPDPTKEIDLIPNKTDEALLRESLKKLLAHFGHESTASGQDGEDKHAQRNEDHSESKPASNGERS